MKKVKEELKSEQKEVEQEAEEYAAEQRSTILIRSGGMCATRKK